MLSCLYLEARFLFLRKAFSFLPVRLWGGTDRLRGQFQFPKPPRPLPAQLPVCVGDPSPAPLPGSDPRFLFGRGGALPLPVWLAGGAGADGAELCGHQVGPSQATQTLQGHIYQFLFMTQLKFGELNILMHSEEMSQRPVNVIFLSVAGFHQ